MKITAPEYLILLGIGILNIWGALILASVRTRQKDESAPLPLPAVEPARMDAVPRSAEAAGG